MIFIRIRMAHELIEIDVVDDFLDLFLTKQTCVYLTVT